MSINNINSLLSNNLSSAATPPVYDGTQGMGDLMNDFWTFFNKVNQGGPTDDAQMEALLTNVNDFLTYIKNNGGNPSPTTDPHTYQVWLAITKIPVGPDGTKTLSSYAADFAANHGTLTYRDLENGIGFSNLMTFVVNPELGSLNWFHGYPNPKVQQNGDTQFLNDMQALYNYVKTFNSSPNSSLAQYVILPAIQKLTADIPSMPSGKLTDGYLKVMNDFLQGTGLASATTTNIFALLTSTGGSNVPLSQDLANFMNQSGLEEYGKGPWQS